MKALFFSFIAFLPASILNAGEVDGFTKWAASLTTPKAQPVPEEHRNSEILEHSEPAPNVLSEAEVLVGQEKDPEEVLKNRNSAILDEADVLAPARAEIEEQAKKEQVANPVSDPSSVADLDLALNSNSEKAAVVRKAMPVF